jgi:hypothetical protein
MSSIVLRTVRLALSAAVFPVAAAAQNTPPTGWFNTAELTAVRTGGNSPASTFGVKNELRRVWPAATLKLEAGALRTESTKRSRTAEGTPTDYSVTETTSGTVTAENYYVRGRYDRTLLSKAFLVAGAGWNRNTFAGIANRYSFLGGAGNAWVDREGARFKTDLGVTYTIQDDVADDPGKSNSFLGLRLTTEALRGLTASTVYSATLVVDENLQDTEDLRADFTNSIRVAINSNLALQTSLQLLYDQLPALVQVPLTAAGVPADTQVLTPLDKLDTVFTVALVIGF